MRLRALLRTMAEVVRGLVYLHSYSEFVRKQSRKGSGGHASQ